MHVPLVRPGQSAHLQHGNVHICGDWHGCSWCHCRLARAGDGEVLAGSCVLHNQLQIACQAEVTVSLLGVALLSCLRLWLRYSAFSRTARTSIETSCCHAALECHKNVWVTCQVSTS